MGTDKRLRGTLGGIGLTGYRFLLPWPRAGAGSQMGLHLPGRCGPGTLCPVRGDPENTSWTSVLGKHPRRRDQGTLKSQCLGRERLAGGQTGLL